MPAPVRALVISRSSVSGGKKAITVSLAAKATPFSATSSLMCGIVVSPRNSQSQRLPQFRCRGIPLRRPPGRYRVGHVDGLTHRVGELALAFEVGARKHFAEEAH